MNKSLLVFLSLFTLLFSCKKFDHTSPDGLVQEARNYFEGEVLTGKAAPHPAQGGLRFSFPGKIADWQKANIQQLRFGPTVVVPLKIPNLRNRDRFGIEQTVQENAFLIVYRDSLRRQHAEVVIKIPDENSTEKAFSGIVQVMDWEGNLIQSYKYTWETEQKVTTSVRFHREGTRTESMVVWCIPVDWVSCAYMVGYPTYCQYNYTTYYCYTENSSAPGSGVTPPSGSCCGSYGSITGGNNSYPLAKELQMIKFDTSIKLISVYPCLTVIFHTLREQKTGFWGKLIYDMTGEVPAFKWRMNQAVLSDPNRAAETGKDNSGTYTTYNTTYLDSATNMSVAKTMLHEGGHAYLTHLVTTNLPAAQNQYPQMFQDYVASHENLTVAQHQEMARSFVNIIALCLKVYGQAKGIQAYDTYYMDLAWGGLMGTSYFNALPEADKTRIKAINQAEAQGKTVVLPGGILVSPLGVRICH